MERNNWAFTLIELIIVLGIIILLSTSTIAFYNNLTELKKLNAEIEKIYHVLNLAYKKTVAGDYSNFNCQNFKGYQVLITGSNTYELQINCNDSFQTIQSYQLENSINLTSTSNTIFFNVLTGYLDNSITSPVTISITNTVISKTKQLQIEKNGKINKL